MAKKKNQDFETVEVSNGVDIVRNGRVVRSLRGDFDKATLERETAEWSGTSSDGESHSKEDVIRRWSEVQEKTNQYYIQEFENSDGENSVALIDKDTGSITAQVNGRETQAALNYLYDNAGAAKLDDGKVPAGGEVQTPIGTRNMGPLGYAGVPVEGVEDTVESRSEANEDFAQGTPDPTHSGDETLEDRKSDKSKK